MVDQLSALRSSPILRSERNILLPFVITVFFLLLAAYGGILILSRSQEATRDELIKEVQFKEEELRPDLVQQIFLIEERLKNLRTLLGQHVTTSRVFQFLETNAHPQVQFLSFNFSSANRTIELTGEALSYAALAQQIGSLERTANIERIDFGGLSTVRNRIAFRLSIVVAPILLHAGE